MMTTASFTKDFEITKRETVERLEKCVHNIKPLNTDSKNVIADMRKSEKKLLNILRST